MMIYKSTHKKGLDLKSKILRSRLYLIYTCLRNKVIHGCNTGTNYWYIKINPQDIKYVNDAKFRLSYVTNRAEYFKKSFVQRDTEQYKTMYNRIILSRDWEHSNPKHSDYKWNLDETLYSYMKERWKQQQILIDYTKKYKKILMNKEMGFKEAYDEVTVNIDHEGQLIHVRGNGGAHRLSTAKILNVKEIKVLVGAIHPMGVKMIMKKNGGKLPD